MTPPILYKYCTPTGVDVLRNLRIKVTPPNQFNDPFELAPRMEQEMSREQAFNSLTEPLVLARTYKQAIDSNQFVGTYDEFLRFIREYSEHFAQGLIKRYPESATEFRRDHINMVSEKVGLVCLSEVPDDILMWSHYSGSHTGLVIGFRTTHPFFASPPLLKVDYQKEPILVGHSVKKDDPQRQERVNALIRRKSPHWKYEREWRQLQSLQQCTTAKDSEIGRIHYFKSFDPALIGKVIIGCRSTNEPEIRELLSDPKFSGVEVLKYEMHESEFSLVPSEAA